MGELTTVLYIWITSCSSSKIGLVYGSSFGDVCISDLF
jgi:hypothetical protein